MRIGIDARFFGPQETGLGRYVDRLIHHLQQIDDHNEYVVFLRRPAFDTWQPSNSKWSKTLADYRWYSLAEQRHMPALLRGASLDLVHFPHFNVPLKYHRPYVVTVHDLTLYRYPTARASTLGFVSFWIKYFIFREMFSRAIRKANAVLTVSAFSKQDIVQRFHIPAEHITVTYESVDPLAPPAAADVLTERGIHQPYLLYVGNAYPHKNLERLLEAWQQSQAGEQGAQLVLVGKNDFFAKRLKTFAEQQHIPGVVWFGFASDTELATVYQRAQAYFFPSLSEGFGLPGLEAMQAGVPVYAARASCLPEIYGQAANYFDPLNVTDIATSIKRALHDTLERPRLIAAGRQRLSQYSWSTMARQTLELYEKTHARTKTPSARPQS